MKRVRQRPDHSKTADRRVLVPVLFVLTALAIVGATVFHESQRMGSSDLSSIESEKSGANRRQVFRKPITFDQRVHQHKIETGDRINRERVMIQLENTTLPGVTNGAQSNVGGMENQVMYGVPLAGEASSYNGAVESSEALPAYDLEAGTTASIKAAREGYERERRVNVQAREQYIREFSENANAMGYKVKIDRDYNVEYAPSTETEDSLPSAAPADASGR